MIAIIPARGGSKGLPGKNLKKISGISLVGIAVKTALNSKCIKRTIVSTDSRDIALEAKKWGAEIPFMRPEYLADDTSSAIDVYIYTLNKLSEIEGTPLAKEFVVLQPTSPLRQAEDIDNAIRIFKQKKADSVISVTPAHHPIWWALKINRDLKLKRFFPKLTIENRQQYPNDIYYPNGAIYVLKSELLISKRSYYSTKTYAYIMPPEKSIDIDTLYDFKVAEYLYRQIKNKKL